MPGRTGDTPHLTTTVPPGSLVQAELAEGPQEMVAAKVGVVVLGRKVTSAVAEGGLPMALGASQL